MVRGDPSNFSPYAALKPLNPSGLSANSYPTPSLEISGLPTTSEIVFNPNPFASAPLTTPTGSDKTSSGTKRRQSTGRSGDMGKEVGPVRSPMKAVS